MNNEEDDVATLDFLRRILSFVDHNQKDQTEKKKNKEKQKKRNQQNQPKIKYYFYID